MKIAVLVPSRGRPDRLTAMLESIRTTATETPGLVTIVDADDPTLEGYRALGLGESLVVLPERVGFTRSLNAIAEMLWDEVDILGAFGDDVLFRTRGWDDRVRETLSTPGIAYGDDLIHGVNHPSAVFMSSAIAKALGWLAMPGTRHQWADDAWKRLGQELGCLRYMPDVVLEHLHPAVNKAPFDATYGWNLDGSPEANARAKADFDGYQEWLQRYLALDIANVRAAIGGST